MSITIELWHILCFAGLIAAFAFWRLFRKFGIIIISAPIISLVIALPVYMCVSHTSSVNRHDRLLEITDWRLRENVTLYEELTWQTVPYKVLKEREQEKIKVKEAYLKGE